jgi:hypothetical protein
MAGDVRLPLVHVGIEIEGLSTRRGVVVVFLLIVRLGDLGSDGPQPIFPLS